ncbi:hypothetical protein [Ferrimicrobium sp.]|uniref:type II secretion system F family protein n=1 Tax=Ferrimicrobium sp. TaxID=2926050 RepID=UPI002628D421|nr:hypothetical protein [Ferrimicrobium sp.]
MIARLTTLLVVSALIAIAAQLSKQRPTTRRHERLLRHLRPAGERHQQRAMVHGTLANSVHRELAVLLVDQSPALYLLTITTNATMLTALFAVALTLVGPNVSVTLLAVPLWFLILGAQRLLLFAAAQQTERALRNDLPLLLSELQAALDRGHSLAAAVTVVAHSTETAWSAHLERASSSLTRGEPIAGVLNDLANIFADPDISRALTLLALSSQHQVAQQLVGQLLTKAKLDHHHRLIAIAGKREQLIWIPVALATLIPGVLLVIVPLIGSLKLLALR